MCSATRLILHLTRNIISCPLHISTLLLYLEGSKKTLDLTPCPPNRYEGCCTALWVNGRHTSRLLCGFYSWLPMFFASTSLFLGCCLFQMVAINSALDFYFLWEVNFPFLNSCLYWLACLHAHCPWVASTPVANQTLSRLSKILISILIQSEIRHIFKSQQHLQVICAEWEQRCGFLHHPKKMSFLFIGNIFTNLKKHSRLSCTFYQFPPTRLSQIKSCRVIILSKEALEGVFVLDKHMYTCIWMYTVRGPCETSCIMSCSRKSGKNGGGFYFPPGKRVNNGQFLLLTCLRKRALKL